jgi:hypothetical protein
MKQTAVEWFFNELSEVERNLINKTFLQNNKTLAGNTLREIFNQAKEMEKQQIIKAVNFGDERGKISTYLTAEQYYNQTNGQKET